MRTARAWRWTGALALAVALLGSAPADALENGLARTPPMGWNPWYRFHCRVGESLVRETADAMVVSGMRAAGYRYLNLDDCWMAPARTASGSLAPDPSAFPGGLRALADYVHARGLRLGIYAAAGRRTCAGRPGSAGHYVQDARAFAAWGIDYVKLDWCRAGPFRRAPYAYAAMRNALRRARRPMVLSISAWGRLRPWAWGGRTGNLWRTTLDADTRRPWPVLLRFVEQNERLAAYARPGAWNDPDILQVGNPALSPVEQRSIFSLWSMMAAPLIAGNDLRSMAASTRSTLTEREVVAIDQDPAGSQGSRVGGPARHEVWVRNLAGGARALLLFNRGAAGSVLSADARRLGLGKARRYRLRNLWSHRTVTTAGPIHVAVAAHGVAMFRVTRIGPAR